MFGILLNLSHKLVDVFTQTCDIFVRAIQLPPLCAVSCALYNVYNFPQNKMNLFILSGHAGDSFAAFLNEVIL